MIEHKPTTPTPPTHSKNSLEESRGDLTRRDQRLEGLNWHNTTASEQALLQRVEGSLKDQPWWPQQATAIPQPAPRAPWYQRMPQPLLWSAAMIACVLLGSASWRLFRPKAPTSTRVSPPQARSQAAVTRRLALKPRQTRMLQRHGRWELRAHGATSLVWRETDPRRVVFSLKQGRIAVHVVPGSMKQFVIKWTDDVALVVKGTRFTVEQRGRWLRLEVTRGAVALRRDGKSLLVKAGAGVRIMRHDGALQQYSLPKVTPRTLPAQLAWLRKQTAALACSQAMDWSERPTLAKQQRKDLLEQTAYILQPKGAFGCITKLWLRIHGLHLSSGSDETALAAAAQSCRQQRQGRASCVRLYRKYLRAYPQGMLREHVLFWLLRDLSQQTSKQRQEAMRLLKQYQRSFPKGQYKRSIWRLQRQIEPRRRAAP